MDLCKATGPLTIDHVVKDKSKACCKQLILQPTSAGQCGKALVFTFLHLWTVQVYERQRAGFPCFGHLLKLSRMWKKSIKSFPRSQIEAFLRRDLKVSSNINPTDQSGMFNTNCIKRKLTVTRDWWKADIQAHVILHLLHRLTLKDFFFFKEMLAFVGYIMQCMHYVGWTQDLFLPPISQCTKGNNNWANKCFMIFILLPCCVNTTKQSPKWRIMFTGNHQVNSGTII